MASCGNACPGVDNAPLAGTPPRGLILEADGRLGFGAIVVGQNPGRAGPAEVQHYLEHGSDYEQQLVAWDTQIRDRIPYFALLRRLLAHLELDGPILWTDVAKCEGKNPPPETLMTCSQKYLARELATAPADWPVIAAGARAFQASGYMAGRRPVLGLSHPTGNFSAKGFRTQVAKLVDDPTHLSTVRQYVRTPSTRVWLK